MPHADGPSPEPEQDPWLDPESLRAAAAAGRTPRESLAHEFEQERELLRTRVRELRANLQARRHDLRRFQASRASEDAIATVTGNIERLRGQITELIAAYEALERRRDAALRSLPGLLDSAAAIAEAERVLHDDS